ncbi:hypothetical protein C9374_010913 [Naegleria lovaniensis]|uniref:Uncharacterized protein n=1 Tax=Naegleria lovaniensis TaxID=51637 RepID=A0AA88KDQ5_NAELO|nr:uncharacterized protein C9374_010913 [Naegleria lovaniensis]KAG2374343.1 hypothetical protein C9374_010913 [Naegleria lovaniensis]
MTIPTVVLFSSAKQIYDDPNTSLPSMSTWNCDQMMTTNNNLKDNNSHNFELTSSGENSCEKNSNILLIQHNKHQLIPFVVWLQNILPYVIDFHDAPNKFIPQFRSLSLVCKDWYQSFNNFTCHEQESIWAAFISTTITSSKESLKQVLSELPDMRQIYALRCAPKQVRVTSTVNVTGIPTRHVSFSNAVEFSFTPVSTLGLISYWMKVLPKVMYDVNAGTWFFQDSLFDIRLKELVQELIRQRYELTAEYDDFDDCAISRFFSCSASSLIDEYQRAASMDHALIFDTTTILNEFQVLSNQFKILRCIARLLLPCIPDQSTRNHIDHLLRNNAIMTTMENAKAFVDDLCPLILTFTQSIVLPPRESHAHTYILFTKYGKGIMFKMISKK